MNLIKTFSSVTIRRITFSIKNNRSIKYKLKILLDISKYSIRILIAFDKELNITSNKLKFLINFYFLLNGINKIQELDSSQFQTFLRDIRKNEVICIIV